MTDPDAVYRTVLDVDTPPRQRSLAALELICHLAKHGEMAFLPDERIARTEICRAVLTAELDSYQTLLHRIGRP
jgi:hypothetical protein